MSKYYCRALTIFLFTFNSMYIAEATACGTVQEAIEGIYGNGPMKNYSKKQLFSSLAKVGGPCLESADAFPVRNQESLIGLFMDERNMGELLRTYGQKIFVNFNCLGAIKNHPDYYSLTLRYKVSACKAGQKVIVVTSDSGANLRSSPESADNKLTVIAKGSELKELGRNNGWIEVEVVSSDANVDSSCKFKSPCTKGFVHESVTK